MFISIQGLQAIYLACFLMRLGLNRMRITIAAELNPAPVTIEAGSKIHLFSPWVDKTQPKIMTLSKLSRMMVCRLKNTSQEMLLSRSS